MKVLKKILTYLILPAAIAALVFALVKSIETPVKFDKERASRESVAIQRLKDIRSLQTAFKTVNGKYTASIDSLIEFYNTADINVVMKVGSNDDSLAVANTQQLKKRRRNITPREMLELYKQGQRLVFSVENKVPVKDTLFNDRSDFVLDSLRYIPFSNGEKIEMDALIKKVSGVNVPLFEAKMPFELLLKGMDKQLIINLKAERKDQDRYPGLMVGSVTTPNNNAGNWE